MKPSGFRTALAAFLPLALFTLITFGHPTAGRADNIAVEVGGEPSIAQALERVIGDLLKEQGHSVSPAALLHVSQLIDCFLSSDMSCAQKVVARAQIDKLVFVMAELDSDASTGQDVVVLTGWLMAGDGRRLASARNTCGDCGLSAVIKSAEKLVSNLVSAQSAHRPPDPPPPSSGDTGSEDRAAPRRPGHPFWQWAVLGVGIAALGTGTAVYFMDEDAGGPPGSKYTDTAAVGVGLGAGGAVLIGTSLLFLLRSPGADSVPVATATDGGLAIGWAGRF
jgi:hypothetical protein